MKDQPDMMWLQKSGLIEQKPKIIVICDTSIVKVLNCYCLWPLCRLVPGWMECNSVTRSWLFREPVLARTLAVWVHSYHHNHCYYHAASRSISCHVMSCAALQRRISYILDLLICFLFLFFCGCWSLSVSVPLLHYAPITYRSHLIAGRHKCCLQPA